MVELSGLGNACGVTYRAIIFRYDSIPKHPFLGNGIPEKLDLLTAPSAIHARHVRGSMKDLRRTECPEDARPS